MKLFRIVIGIFTILLGVIAVQHVFDGLEETILPLIEYLPLLLLMLFTFGAFKIDRDHYKFDKKLYQYIPSTIGLVFCGIVFFKLIQFKLTDYSTTILKVST